MPAQAHGMTFLPQPKPKPRLLVREEQKRRRDRQAVNLRAAIRKRDSNRCRVCGRLVHVGAVRGCERAEIHHIQPRSIAPERVLDPENLILVDGFCHARLTAHEIAIVGTQQATCRFMRGPNFRPGR